MLYLGYTAKCHSAIDCSIKLYQLSLKMLSTSANIALNLVHMYEIACNYKQAIQVIKTFCNENNTMKLGLHTTSGSTCKEFLRLLLGGSCRNIRNYNIIVCKVIMLFVILL